MSRCVVTSGYGSVVVDDVLMKRVRALITRVGLRGAQSALGVGNATFAAARDRGRMKASTRERIVKELDRLDRETAATNGGIP